jgi:hypothetical protein
LDQTVEKYIHLLLREHFFGVDQIVTQFTAQKKKNEEDSGSSSLDSSQEENTQEMIKVETLD